MPKRISKYDREQEIHDDKRQSKFSNAGEIEKPIGNIKEDKVNTTMTVYCPFCLYRDKLQRFIISDSKGGLSTNKAKCPECKQGMLFRTVRSMHFMSRSKIKAYARWVANYRRAFWHKCRKDIWDERLKEYKWNGIFWSEYKNQKTSISRPQDNREDSEYD